MKTCLRFGLLLVVLFALPVQLCAQDDDEEPVLNTAWLNVIVDPNGEISGTITHRRFAGGSDLLPPPRDVEVPADLRIAVMVDGVEQAPIDAASVGVNQPIAMPTIPAPASSGAMLTPSSLSAVRATIALIPWQPAAANADRADAMFKKTVTK